MTETKRDRYIRILSGLTDIGATLSANATAEILELLKEPIVDVFPYDVCRYAPPSSVDGKPCTLCPAEGR